jgi:flagellar biosynthesis protein FlhA
VRVTDNLQLRPREYVVLLKGVEIARFELHFDSVLAIKAGHANGVIEGVACKEPAFGLDGLWVPQEQSDKARLLGYTVVDSANVVATHLTELIRRHSHELFTRQDADGLLQRIKDENPKLIEDLVPQMMSLSIVQKVLQNLLRERVSIRDAVSILEALSEAGSATKNPTLLTEYVRQALGRSVVRPYLDDNGDLPAYLLGPALESLLQAGVEHNEQGSRLTMDPAALGEAARQIKKTVGELHGPTALVCSSAVRFAVRQLVESDMPLLAAISHAEVPAAARVVSLGAIG